MGRANCIDDTSFWAQVMARKKQRAELTSTKEANTPDPPSTRTRWLPMSETSGDDRTKDVKEFTEVSAVAVRKNAEIKAQADADMAEKQALTQRPERELT